MRIGVNARMLQEAVAGIPRFILGMVESMAVLAPQHEIHLFVSRSPFANLAVEQRILQNPRLVVHPSRFRSGGRVARALWDCVVVGLEARRRRMDVLWGPSFAVPFLGVKTVLTVHDLVLWRTPLFRPTVGERSFAWFHRRVLVPAGCRWAKAIATDSESTRADLTMHVGVDGSLVHVVPGGVDAAFRVLADESPVGDAAAGGKPYILNVAAIMHRKNQRKLVEAFARLQTLGMQGHRLVLVASASNDQYRREVEATIERLELTGKVVFASNVRDEELVRWYNEASLFVYPSLYEGFGLPILEAMACGVPVVTSNVSSLPEAAGDAALLVDPNDPEAIARTMYLVLTQEGLRRKLVARGLGRVERFGWGNAAGRMLKICEEVGVQ